MSGFDEWFDGNKRTLYEDEKWVAKKAWGARQAEIDELQAMYEKQGLYAFELQKKIDEALHKLDEFNCPPEYGIDEIFKVIDLLKGNQNEN